jgi:hypothetical protein
MANKIYELESQLRSTVQEMKSLNETVNMSDSQVKEWDEKKVKVSNLENEIKRAKETEDLNKKLAGYALRNEEDGEKKDIVKSFDRAFTEYIQSSGKVLSADFVGRENGMRIPNEILRAQSIFRADPITSTTNTALVPVTVANNLNMVTGDDFTLLQFLGVPFYTGLTGTHELPYAVQGSSSKPGEGGDASTYNGEPLAAELKPQTYSIEQSWSKMSLLNMPTSIRTGFINDMQLAGERDAVKDLFTAMLQTDSSIASLASGLTYGDMINLTKINYNIGAAKFVVGNDLRVYLEQKAVNSTGIALSWNALNNTVGGRQAIGTDTLAAKRAIYGNFSKATAFGIWGTPEIVIDGTTKAGMIKVSTLGFYKPVVTNKYAYKFFSADASCGI